MNYQGEMGFESGRVGCIGTLMGQGDLGFA